MNLSEKSFTKAQYKLLGYNLNYIPTPNHIDKKELFSDIKKFGRRIKLPDHFGNTSTDKPAFKNISTWEPNNSHHMVMTFMEDFTRKVNNELESGTRNERKGSKTQNLSKAKQEALDQIKSMNDIIITKADKGGACVIQDVRKYIDEAERQLSDRTFYKKVNTNPTDEHAALVANALDDLKQQELLDERTAEK